MLCPDCKACQISSLADRCGSDSTLQAAAMQGVPAALERYRSAVPAAHRVWLNVPYAEKNLVKNMMARWCPDAKKWYIDSRRGERHVDRFTKWIVKTEPVAEAPTANTAAVSFNELMDAIKYGDSVKGAATIPPSAPLTEYAYFRATVAKNA